MPLNLARCPLNLRRASLLSIAETCISCSLVMAPGVFTKEQEEIIKTNSIARIIDKVP